MPLLAGGTTIASLGTTLVEVGLPICENATRLAVAGFFEATARGDASDADGHFATDDFDEYTELPYRTDDEARRRDTLLEYLQTRGAEGSRLYLVSQQYHGGTGDRLANFGAVALNENSATIWGTGTVNCQSGEIVALYLAAPTPPTPGSETEPLLLGSADVDGYADGQCMPTIPTEEFVPPEPYIPSRAADGLVWHGTNEIWTALSINGDHSPRKSVWWSVNFPGGTVEESPVILVEWTRLDTNAPAITNGSVGTNAYTDEDGWFIIGGIDPDVGGCWRVTATYKGASMSYVYERS